LGRPPIRKDVVDKVRFFEPIVQVIGGHSSSMVVTKSGKIYAFGEIVNSYIPKQIWGLETEKIKQISLGNKVAVFLTDTGGIYIFGKSNAFKLGEEYLSTSIPVKLPYTSVVYVSLGYDFELAIIRKE
jgi:alpha-tubulin suppressor-like RCC1 family protein